MLITTAAATRAAGLDGRPQRRPRHAMAEAGAPGAGMPDRGAAAAARGPAARRSSAAVDGCATAGRGGGTVVIGGSGAGGAKRGWPDADDAGVTLSATSVTVTAAAVAAAAVPTADNRLPQRRVDVRRGAAGAADGPSAARRPPPHAQPGLAECISLYLSMLLSQCRHFSERKTLQQGRSGCQGADNRVS